jgi:hypothetical protein
MVFALRIRPEVLGWLAFPSVLCFLQPGFLDATQTTLQFIIK